MVEQLKNSESDSESPIEYSSTTGETKSIVKKT